jgi:crotonobetainyl-CoA:carnitine CoA-transferase CaiB-like acyl-CoA transferase
MTLTAPLGAFRIVELNAPKAAPLTRLAVAMAGRIAADLGADVIKIEPPGGDPLRAMPPFLARGAVAERSAVHQFLNAGKRSVVVPHTARDILAGLLATADALLTDDPERISATPAVCVLVTPFSEWEKKLPAVAEIDIMAASGLLDLIGDPAREPLMLAGHQCAYMAGLAAFTGLVAALAREGAPEIVDVSVLDVACWSNWKSFAERLYTGRTPTRLGELTEWQIFPCADGHVAFVYTEREFAGVCRMVGDPALRDERFSTRAGRIEHAAALLPLLRPWFAGRTRAKIHEESKRNGLPIAPVWRVTELGGDPQYLAQKFLSELTHPTLGALTMPTLPVTWNGARLTPRLAPVLAEAAHE